MLSFEDRKRFQEDGFLRVRGVFTPTEVARFRAAADRLESGEADARSLIDVPEMADFWRDPRMLEIASDILGGPLVYFFSGHFHRYDFSKGANLTARHLHHDAKGSIGNIFNRVNETLETPYPVLRFGIYLQDTQTQSGGLKVAVGSHLRDVSDFKQTDFRLQNIASQPGDVIAFTHRLLHSPLALRFKDGRDTVLTTREEDVEFLNRPEQFLPIPQIRQTIFTDYSIPSDLSDLYIKNRAIQPLAESDGNLSKLLVDDGFLAANANCGIGFRIDRAIVETVEFITRHAGADKRLDDVGIAHLARLPALCRAHVETTPIHSLFQGEVKDTSLDTAARLFGLLGRRIDALRSQSKAPTRISDRHMKYTPMAERAGQG